jgi:hypothetical protein
MMWTMARRSGAKRTNGLWRDKNAKIGDHYYNINYTNNLLGQYVSGNTYR